MQNQKFMHIYVHVLTEMPVDMWKSRRLLRAWLRLET